MNMKEIYIQRVTSMHQRHDEVQRRLVSAFKHHELVNISLDSFSGAGYFCSPQTARSLWEVGLRSTRAYARDLGLQDESWAEDLRVLNTGELPKIDKDNPDLCPECGVMMMKASPLYRICRSEYHPPVVKWDREV